MLFCVFFRIGNGADFPEQDSSADHGGGKCKKCGFDYASVGSRFAAYYIVYLLFFSVVSAFVYARRYDRSRRDIKKFFARLNKLEHFYDKNRKNNTER